jgi:hypothetical protein
MSLVSAARPARSLGSWLQPPGSMKLNAVDSNDGIGSPRSTMPLARV